MGFISAALCASSVVGIPSLCKYRIHNAYYTYSLKQQYRQLTLYSEQLPEYSLENIFARRKRTVSDFEDKESDSSVSITI